MDCLVCQRPSGYNRAVVDLESGREVGPLCVSCEREQFGEFSDELGAPGADTCVFCDRDAFWALPKWLPATYQVGHRTVSYVDYDPSTAALVLCDEHLERLGVDDVGLHPATDVAHPRFLGRAED
jgi:hypothetical protein